ncbi:MAG: hypothetical protein Q9159_004827 [Coniocarpon cinnabarinum]
MPLPEFIATAPPNLIDREEGQTMAQRLPLDIILCIIDAAIKPPSLTLHDSEEDREVGKQQYFQRVLTLASTGQPDYLCSHCIGIPALNVLNLTLRGQAMLLNLISEKTLAFLVAKYVRTYEYRNDMA